VHNPAIEVHQLRYRYPRADRETLHGLDFAVERGEILGFLGPSGSGKSTTQKILIGLIESGWTGEVTVLGQRPRAAADFYEHIGVGFEQPNLYLKLTARENLEFVRALYAGETADPIELLERVGLRGRADTRVAEFSKGMKMRLNFCRALLPRPRVLFLDEPTAGQDPGHAALLEQIIRELRDEQGTTVFLTTHNMREAARLCDRVAFIVDGALALIDEPRALTLRHGRRRVRVEWAGEHEREHADFDLDHLADDPAFLSCLADRRDRLLAIHSQEATLEDVFLAETGRALQ
jgi:fluoroquinolone transport system ATP-binding protein